MKLTEKLVSYLHRGFTKDPRPFLALRLNYDGAMSWRIEDGRLYTTVTGGSGANLNVALANYTIGTLATHLASNGGYTVPYVITGPLANLSALSLLDASGNQANSNGDHLKAFDSLAWAYMDAAALELKGARESISTMLLQLVMRTAEGEWLEELASYYNVERLPGETDAQLAVRAIIEVARPRGNNVAIELALSEITEGNSATVEDAPLVNGNYGFFDVTAEVTQGDFDEFLLLVRDVISRFRDAGTRPRYINGTLTREATICVGASLESGGYSYVYPAGG